ncbi:hypothetical protein [Streptomyces longhuiensis]|uniref:hypothetical protein n=1 Tax=Streptomyces longhuiensis TaxID=2880933 RepID=UPI001D0ADE81|nr:hypothetical protein [Streptomyces longhuiensis]UDL98396.1 hypothetical protein LGI35_09085 [Streptomyces longhuiensis]
MISPICFHHNFTSWWMALRRVEQSMLAQRRRRCLTLKQVPDCSIAQLVAVDGLPDREPAAGDRAAQGAWDGLGEVPHVVQDRPGQGRGEGPVLDVLTGETVLAGLDRAVQQTFRRQVLELHPENGQCASDVRTSTAHNTRTQRNRSFP